VGAGSEQPAAIKGGVELADIFRAYGESYRRNHPLPVSHLKVMQAVMRCRTAALGGHLEQCDRCGFERPAYNSCRNRHCPKCQSLAKVKWLDKQKSELLPVGYFHLVFTLPHQLNGLILTNKKILLDHLFKAVGETLVDFGRTRLGGQIGFVTVLHTWDQTLLDHFHLHCLVPAGVLSFDRNRWVSARQDFLFPVKALSLVFRAKFLDSLKKSFDQNKLLFVGQITSWADARSFDGLLERLRKKPWVVYAKKPFGSPVHVLDYLGRYAHRVALSNDRILSAHSGEVTFSYRDRKNEDRQKTMTLDAYEFIRRFLLHVIPKGFVRVRHFGFLANKSKSLLSKCRQLLDLDPTVPKLSQRSVHEMML
jgi:predicted Zn-ribbon and HTH transcriptional regulator